MMDGTEKESDANSPYEVPEAETMNIHGPDLHSLFVTDRRSSKTQFSEETVRSSKSQFSEETVRSSKSQFSEETVRSSKSVLRGNGKIQ
jgi:hypothetical protein